MAAPHPPQGNQTPHTERPLKIYAEQLMAGAELPIGVEIDPGNPPIYNDGQPRVLLPTGWAVIQVTDWVISSRYSGKPLEVISAEEFTERFGPSE